MSNSLRWWTVVILIAWVAFGGHPFPRESGRASGGDDKVGGETNLKSDTRPPYVHTVVFYLKQDAPQGEAERIIADAHGLLAKIPSVKGLWIGRPAEKATPKLAVTDYHIAWTMLFEDYAGLQEYLEHKAHVEFREKHAKHAERVLIYDFINQKK